MKKIEFFGALVGRSWYGGTCQKSLSRSYSRLRFSAKLIDLAKSICKDGDFQGCKFTGDSVIVFTRSRRSGNRMRTFEKSIPITDFLSIAEFVDAEVATYYEDYDEN